MKNYQRGKENHQDQNNFCFLWTSLNRQKDQWDN